MVHNVTLYHLNSITSSSNELSRRYDTGIISGAMLLMKSEFNLTVFEQSTIVTVTIVGAWLFSLISGYSADRFGRLF